MAEKIIVTIDLESGDAESFKQALDGLVTKQAEKASKSFSQTFSKKFAAEASNVASSLNVSIGNLATTALKATTAVAGLAASFLAFKSIDAAQVQQDAVNNLNNALKTAGDFSKQASEEMQVFASALQNVTRFGDETVLNQLALAKSFGATNEQAKQIVRAAADLSAAFGIDLESATRNVAKTLGGLSGELGESIPQLKTLGAEALKAGRGIDIIAERFSGAAQRDVKSYSGALDQLKNAFGDTLEEIGKIIINSPKLVAAFKAATSFFVDLTKQIAGFGKSFDVFDFAINKFIEFNDVFINFVIAPFEQLFNIFGVVQGALNTFVAVSIAGLGNLGLAVAELLDLFGVKSGLAQALRTFEESSEETALGVAKAFGESLNSISDFPLSDALLTKNEELRTFFQQQQQISSDAQIANQEILNTSNNAAQESLMTWRDAFASSFDYADGKALSLQEQIKATNELMKKFARESSASLRDGFARGAGQAFAAFGKAVANGENALGAFAEALFKSIADQAIALGTNYILTGTAMLFSPNPKDQAQAPFLIKSGAALAAFGGFLGASIGGGGGAGGGTAGNTGIGEGNIPVTNDVANPNLEETRNQPATNVSVVVQGSLVRQDELGQFITETLNESFAKQGVTLTDARFMA